MIEAIVTLVAAYLVGGLTTFCVTYLIGLGGSAIKWSTKERVTAGAVWLPWSFKLMVDKLREGKLPRLKL